VVVVVVAAVAVVTTAAAIAGKQTNLAVTSPQELNLLGVFAFR
jgi:hypothetical protein